MNTIDRHWLSRKSFRSVAGVALYVVALVVVPAHHARADTGVKLLQYGAWGLSVDPEPFKGKFPAVIYVPPGTIVFATKPGSLNNFVSVQLHYGHWVQIEKTQSINGKPVEILTPIEGLVESPPSNTIMVHRSILCLDQTNRIAKPPEKCKRVGTNLESEIPVGKGWIYTFRPSSKSGWLDLSVRLDEGTKKELQSRGLTPGDANFEIARRDVDELERQGYLTTLDKNLPIAVFEYQNRSPVYIECGQKKVTEKALKGSAKLKAEGGVGFEAPLWVRLISGLKGKLGLSAEAGVSAETGTTWTISVDTTKLSYLYYAATMFDSKEKKLSNIIIEKIFECKPPPIQGPGNRMISVRFELEPPDGGDLREFEFTNAADYLPVPEKLYNHQPRPVFLSINSPEQYETALSKVIQTWAVDINLAHFMLANINYSCNGKTRDKCAELIDQASH